MRLGTINTITKARRSPRTRILLATSADFPPAGQSTVVIHNLSATGALLETDMVLVVGNTLSVDLPHGGIAQARVAWKCDRYYGCEFGDPISRRVISAALLKSSFLSSPVAASELVAGPGETWPWATRLRLIFALSAALWALIFAAFSLLL